ncbi:uncharacterized protein BDV17DRAFT_22013 [Aspergillus undulatus]|uniref:uncharacterized protein n=1 Tax=Aspergillus undulatus TaxID=1810928 RepID=UPI003CCD27E0
MFQTNIILPVSISIIPVFYLIFLFLSDSVRPAGYPCVGGCPLTRVHSLASTTAGDPNLDGPDPFDWVCLDQLLALFCQLSDLDLDSGHREDGIREGFAGAVMGHSPTLYFCREATSGRLTYACSVHPVISLSRLSIKQKSNTYSFC